MVDGPKDPKDTPKLPESVASDSIAPAGEKQVRAVPLDVPVGHVALGGPEVVQ